MLSSFSYTSFIILAKEEEEGRTFWINFYISNSILIVYGNKRKTMALTENGVFLMYPRFQTTLMIFFTNQAQKYLYPRISANDATMRHKYRNSCVFHHKTISLYGLHCPIRICNFIYPTCNHSYFIKMTDLDDFKGRILQKKLRNHNSPPPELVQ